MDVLAERGQLGVGADHVLAHVLGVGARVADPLDPVDRVDREPSSSAKRDPLLSRQVAPVAVHVLAQQGHLAHALRGQPLDLRDQLAGRAADLAAACLGDDAVGAGAVAAQPRSAPSPGTPARAWPAGRPGSPRTRSTPAPSASPGSGTRRAGGSARARTPRRRTGTARRPRPSPTAPSSHRPRPPARGPRT